MEESRTNYITIEPQDTKEQSILLYSLAHPDCSWVGQALGDVITQYQGINSPRNTKLTIATSTKGLEEALKEDHDLVLGLTSLPLQQEGGENYAVLIPKEVLKRQPRELVDLTAMLMMCYNPEGVELKEDYKPIARNVYTYSDAQDEFAPYTHPNPAISGETTDTIVLAQLLPGDNFFPELAKTSLKEAIGQIIRFYDTKNRSAKPITLG